MKTRERYVFDTNVLISALLFERSKPGQAFYSALSRGDILLSMPVIRELGEVLSRAKFEKYVSLEDRQRFLAALLRDAVLVEITEHVRVCRDPKDDKFLELAVSGAASYLVTGDSDLLDLHEYRGVIILTPDELIASVQ
jgi:putative PIN family toxin of toxin-antitoxin system